MSTKRQPILVWGSTPPPPKHTLEDDTRHTYDCKGERPRKETTRDDEFMLPSS